MYNPTVDEGRENGADYIDRAAIVCYILHHHMVRMCGCICGQMLPWSLHLIRQFPQRIKRPRQEKKKHLFHLRSALPMVAASLSVNGGSWSLCPYIKHETSSHFPWRRRGRRKPNDSTTYCLHQALLSVLIAFLPGIIFKTCCLTLIVFSVESNSLRHFFSSPNLKKECRLWNELWL